MAYETAEDFFLNKVNIDKIFEFTERWEYLFLYNIKKCVEISGDDKTYMSELAQQMRLSVTETSKAVKNLEDNGYVIWNTDENKERTYVRLTGKAKDAMAHQHEKMERVYKMISSEISNDDMSQTVATLGKIREIIKKVNTEK